MAYVEIRQVKVNMRDGNKIMRRLLETDIMTLIVTQKPQCEEMCRNKTCEG